MNEELLDLYAAAAAVVPSNQFILVVKDILPSYHDR